MKLKELAKRLDCELRGDGSVEITSAATLESAGENDITFLSNHLYRKFLDNTNASAIILGEDENFERIPSLRSNHPHLLFARTLEILYKDPPRESGVADSADVASDAVILSSVRIAELCFVGARSALGENTILEPQVHIGNDVTIGANCHFYPGVVILDRCVIGDNVILNAGVIVGSDGYGYASDQSGHHKVKQIGAVIIENDVEIGANSCIDRGALGPTIIRRGVKIDNLVQIAHNVEIGENSLIVAQVGIAGSTKFGANVVLGGQVGVIGHLTIGPGARVAAQSGITRSLEGGKSYMGMPIREAGLAKRIEVTLSKLPTLAKRVSALEKRLAESDVPDSQKK